MYVFFSHATNRTDAGEHAIGNRVALQLHFFCPWYFTLGTINIHHIQQWSLYNHEVLLTDAQKHNQIAYLWASYHLHEKKVSSFRTIKQDSWTPWVKERSIKEMDWHVKHDSENKKEKWFLVSLLLSNRAICHKLLIPVMDWEYAHSREKIKDVHVLWTCLLMVI